jgi:predicted nucleotidyltransferase
MVKTGNIKEIAQRLKEEAKKDNININSIYLFGSYANGKAHEYSDIDLAVLSDDFEGIRYFDNLKISPSKLRTNRRLELHPYKTEDFNKNDPFVKEILESGIRVM